MDSSWLAVYKHFSSPSTYFLLASYSYWWKKPDLRDIALSYLHAIAICGQGRCGSVDTSVLTALAAS